MVRACCVPGCTSEKLIPRHKLPKDVMKAETWLKAIRRDELIDLDGLRICALHFSDDMIFIDRSRRCFKENAYPSMHISFQNSSTNNTNTTISTISTIAASSSSISFNTPENVEANERFVPTSEEIKIREIKKKHEECCKELRKCKKTIYKKRKIIKKQQQKLKKKKNKWEDLTSRLPTFQKFYRNDDRQFTTFITGMLLIFFKATAYKFKFYQTFNIK
ncbi:hypothetical protein PUN28_011887 [Cardiocondyla obscurior]|uniref:THAP-type domain-containing protein n=1 Tax=Cardiocondyla obscurior TaxID=286306 RepID=A0AAW2FHD2_9HYME